MDLVISEDDAEKLKNDPACRKSNSLSGYKIPVATKEDMETLRKLRKGDYEECVRVFGRCVEKRILKTLLKTK